jgi:beta-ureidopropionase / N-carbamoyl-L-amino-acid hydrolase
MDRREFGRRLLGLGAGALALPFDGFPTAGGRATAPAPALAADAGAPRVDGERLLRRFEGLKRFGGTPEGGLHRVAYSEADREARAYVMELMDEAGLEPRVDAGGNLLGRREGRETDLPPLLFGSHIDSVPNGGHYDGQVGSMGAVEVAHSLSDHGIRTRHPIEVVIFQNEEGGLYGSRIMSGEFEPRELEIEAASGHTIREGIRLLGGDPDRLGEARRRSGEVAGFLELHIEQGSVLHSEGIDVGVVQGIVGIRWWEVEVRGFANHAGTTPMDARRDALLAAARYIEAVNRVVRRRPGAQVGTVGHITAEPGASNVIPGRVLTSLELRDLSMDTIEALYADIRREVEAIERETETSFDFALTVDLDPAPVDEAVQDLVEASARGLGLSTLRMPSGAGHDAQSMARIAPVGMIFVPSVEGVSHSPEELTRPEDIVNGADVLLRSVLELDATLS